jgi:hypothetical protein
MKDFLNDQFKKEAARGMAFTLLFLICIQNLCTSIMTALAGTNWAAADTQTRFLIVTSITANFSGALIAFFRQKLTALVTGGSLVSEPEPKKGP